MSHQYNDYGYGSGGGYAQGYDAPQQLPGTTYYSAGAYDSPSHSTTTTPPAYASQTHLADPEAQYRAQSPLPPLPAESGPAAAAPYRGAGPGAGASPFDTVFDDHAYPAAGYYGQPNAAAAAASSDAIPLRDRAAGKNGVGLDSDSVDHVYDVPQGGLAASGAAGGGRGRGKTVRFGELGMLGANSKRIPIVVYILTLAQVAVFIAEVVKNGVLTGSPIMIHPSFNPMIGPSSYVLINMGSRFVPCMHNVAGVQSSTEVIQWPCPNSTTNLATDPSNMCTLSELCGFGGVPEPLYQGDSKQTPEPNQWFRFIVPIFLHAGVIHIGFNMLLQMTMGRDMERSIGSIRFFLVYFSSGIFGFVMGGNYAATGISSTGASGSLFGIIALTLLDLLYSWRDRRNPVKDLLFILLDVIISFVLGLLPGLDNFSHIGGFIMGLALGISVLHSPNALRRRIGEDSSYASVSGTYSDNLKTAAFFRSPIGFFKGRKPLWWGWWLLRAGAIVLVIVLFILLLNNFYYYHHTCSWCKYLSCLPVSNWCDIGNLQLTNTTTKRDVFSSVPRLARVL